MQSITAAELSASYADQVGNHEVEREQREQLTARLRLDEYIVIEYEVFVPQTANLRTRVPHH